MMLYSENNPKVRKNNNNNKHHLKLEIIKNKFRIQKILHLQCYFCARTVMSQLNFFQLKMKLNDVLIFLQLFSTLLKMKTSCRILFTSLKDAFYILEGLCINLSDKFSFISFLQRMFILHLGTMTYCSHLCYLLSSTSSLLILLLSTKSSHSLSNIMIPKFYI